MAAVSEEHGSPSRPPVSAAHGRPALQASYAYEHKAILCHTWVRLSMVCQVAPSGSLQIGGLEHSHFQIDNFNQRSNSGFCLFGSSFPLISFRPFELPGITGVFVPLVNISTFEPTEENSFSPETLNTKSSVSFYRPQICIQKET